MKRSQVPSQAEYERRTLDEAIQREREIDAQSLADRKEAQAQFLEAMRERPDVVAERIGWLLDGNYGRGEMQVARNTTSRMNRPAIFTQLIAVYEWQCPRRMAIDAWKKLSAGEKARLQSEVEAVIQAAVANGEL